MKVIVSPSEVSGEVAAPPSKSMTHRALVLAALSSGKSIIRNPLESDDTEATSRVLTSLGVKVTRGVEWEVEGGHTVAPLGDLYCGESGATLRFAAAGCGLVDGHCRLTGGPSLTGRPLGPLLEAIKALGVKSTSRGGYPPVDVEGNGRIDGGQAVMPGNVSSQFISAILLVSPLADSPVEISVTTPLESKPYVNMTMDAMRLFGVEVKASSDMRRFTTTLNPYRAATVGIEGDWSSAALIIAAGVLAGETRVTGLNRSSSQADRAILDILARMGGELTSSSSLIKTDKSRLTGIEHDLSNCPDLFPVVTALCASSRGESRLTGLSRLSLKESDRLDAMVDGLRRMGASIEANESEAMINGGKLSGAEIDPRRDHRIAMAFTLLALAAEGETTIKDAECVSKSYPSFWEDLEGIGAKIRRVSD